nr:aminodeoxychorismate lyase [Actinomycetales bacterium]
MFLLLVDPVTGETSPAALDSPLLAADDLAAIRGDGVFEAALLRDGEIRALEMHLARFANSARLLDLPGTSREVWEPALLQAATEAPDPGGDRVIRWFLSRGREGTGLLHGWIMVGMVPQSTLEMRRNGITAVTLTRGVPAGLAHEAPWLLIGVKSLSYAGALAATRFAKGRGADEAIFLTTDGFVLEAPLANVVLAQGDTLVTPDPALGLLHGTTQRFLFDRAGAAGWECRYARVRREELFSADGVWLVSSTRMAVPVHTINGTSLPTRPGIHRVMDELIN